MGRFLVWHSVAGDDQVREHESPHFAQCPCTCTCTCTSVNNLLLLTYSVAFAKCLFLFNIPSFIEQFFFPVEASVQFTWTWLRFSVEEHDCRRGRSSFLQKFCLQTSSVIKIMMQHFRRSKAQGNTDRFCWYSMPGVPWPRFWNMYAACYCLSLVEGFLVLDVILSV